MATLFYVHGLRGPQPQLDHNDRLVITEGIRGRVVAGTARQLTAIEETLSLRELEGRYPPPMGEVVAA